MTAKKKPDWVEPQFSDIDVGADPAALDVKEEQFSDLVEMHRNGEYLHVHPSCVAAHEQIGWKVVG